MAAFLIYNCHIPRVTRYVLYWKYCVKTCIHNGKDNHQMVQCHLCQSWVHPECVGEDDKDIVGIWSCTSCRMLPTLAERLLEKTSLLESLVVTLERSNQQLVSLMGEQSQEIRGLRDDIETSKRPDDDGDANDGRPQAVTLLVGNSLYYIICPCLRFVENLQTLVIDQTTPTIYTASAARPFSKTLTFFEDYVELHIVKWVKKPHTCDYWLMHNSC